MQYGYIRLSSICMNPYLQIANLEIVPELIYTETYPSPDLPIRSQLLNTVINGDVIHIQSLDRLFLNVNDLVNISQFLLNKNVIVHSHKEGFILSSDPEDKNSRNFINLVHAMPQWENRLYKEFQEEGFITARNAGKLVGRPSSVSEAQKKEALRLIRENHHSILQISKETGVPKSTCYRLRDVLKNEGYPNNKNNSDQE